MAMLGLLGGMSWESTAQYYRLANELTAQRLGGLHSADLLLRSVDFADVEALQVSGDWAGAGRLLAAEAVRLERAGCAAILLCTNTMHKVADAVEAACSIPLVHLAEVTADAVLATPVRRVGLLGTAYTMEQAFYRDRLTARGLDVIVPDAADRALVQRVIFEELCRGVFTDASRRAFEDVCTRLVTCGADGIILGCTEIELLLPAPDVAGVPAFPTTRLHVTAGLDLLASLA